MSGKIRTRKKSENTTSNSVDIKEGRRCKNIPLHTIQLVCVPKTPCVLKPQPPGQCGKRLQLEKGQVCTQKPCRKSKKLNSCKAYLRAAILCTKQNPHFIFCCGASWAMNAERELCEKRGKVYERNMTIFLQPSLFCSPFDKIVLANCILV